MARYENHERVQLGQSYTLKGRYDLPDRRVHAGQKVIVIRHAPIAEYWNHPGERLHFVRAFDGWEGIAFDSELE